jgi:hypothetical protein
MNGVTTNLAKSELDLIGRALDFYLDHHAHTFDDAALAFMFSADELVDKARSRYAAIHDLDEMVEP